MAENSKKRPRKAKLVLRECIDLVDDTIEPVSSSSQMQVSPFQSSQLKLKTIYSEFHVKTPSSPVQFDIQVDVETINNDDMCQDLNTDKELISTSEVIISEEAIRTEIEKLISTNNYVDKMIGISLRNFWGKDFIHHIPNNLEKLINNVVREWQQWCFVKPKKAGETISVYKCAICYIGWWHLEPFRDHIMIHEKINVRLISTAQESFVVASQNEWYESRCLCRIEGNCPKCLKTYDEHNALQTGSVYYYCRACQERFVSCRRLFVHEGLCVRYQIMTFKKSVPAQTWRCQICHVSCLTQARHEQHLINYHCVRSDSPSSTPVPSECHACEQPYLIHNIHACPKKVTTYRCKFCNRSFSKKALVQIHNANTRKEATCDICDIKVPGCALTDHLFKSHRSNFLEVYKCSECLDHVLTWRNIAFRSHRHHWHQRKIDNCKNLDFYKILVPVSCMQGSWADGVNVSDMVIANLPPVLAKPKNKVESVTDILQKKYESALEKAEVSKETQELESKLLKRASIPTDATWPETNTLQVKKQATKQYLTPKQIQAKKNEELENAIKDIQKEDAPIEVSLDENEKKCFDDDVMVTDDDIIETQNSVDALLTGFVLKSEIKIEEQYWDQITLDDDANHEDEHAHDVEVKLEVAKKTVNQEESSQESVHQLLTNIKQEKLGNNETETIKDRIQFEDDNDLDSLKKDVKTSDLQPNLNKTDDIKNKNHEQIAENKVSDVNVDLSIVKQEPNSEEVNVETKVSTKDNKFTIDIKTEVVIKEEKEDLMEFKETEITREQDACLEELSKVFKVSNDVSKIELSGISLSEDVDIKEELLDPDEYEDDIIMLYNEPPSFDLTEQAEDYEEASTSDISKDILSSESVPSKRKVGINSGPFKRIITSDIGDEIIYKKEKKTYRCKRCKFMGNHEAYKKHKTEVCKVKKHLKRGNRATPQIHVWPEIHCTKCDCEYTIKSYYFHFHKHGVKKGLCPVCSHLFTESAKAVSHLKSHILNSFVKMQLLNTTFDGARNKRLFQCKVCQEEVQRIDMFVHWERHLELAGERATEEGAPPPEDPPQDTATDNPLLLTNDQAKKLLDQLVCPRGGIDKRCSYCRRQFMRCNDVKRHAIEHLLMDARVRRPSLVCRLCQHRSGKPDAYKIHMRSHASLPVYRCELCDKCFSDSSNFSKHKKIHNLQSLSICDLCKKKFQSKQGLEKHMELHMTMRPLPCALCGQTFFTQSQLNKHHKNRHMRHTLTKACAICRERFSTLRHYWDHMWEEHNERRVQADCPVCHVSFRKIHDVFRHVREKHKAEIRRARAVGGGKKIKDLMTQLTKQQLQPDTLVVYDYDD